MYMCLYNSEKGSHFFWLLMMMLCFVWLPRNCRKTKESNFFFSPQLFGTQLRKITPTQLSLMRFLLIGVLFWWIHVSKIVMKRISPLFPWKNCDFWDSLKKKKEKEKDGALVDLNILIAYMSRGYLFSGDPENI